MDNDTLTPQDIEALLPIEVKTILAEETEFIINRVKAHSKESRIQSGLTWLPYVGDVFEVNIINTAAATSDINREVRVAIVVGKIEKAFGTTLGHHTIRSIRELIDNLYNTDIDL